MRTPNRRRVSWNFAGLLLTAVAFALPRTASADICHADDVIIDGSLNVGFDSVCNRNFGFDTIVLSENNLRIFFEDTSNSASFPTNDWRIVINDTSNGGGNYFAVEDSSAARQPFRIEAGARVNALYVESDGDVGLGTSNPVVNLHIVDGNTPTVRLDQDGSSGFTPQTWDLAGNETNFFIRDVTNGSKLPFRIRPNTPTSAIDMFSDRIEINGGGASYDTRIEGDTQVNLFYADASMDRIGIGTAAPLARLHVVSGAGSGGTVDVFSSDAAFDSDDTIGNGISILSPNGGSGRLNFGRTNDNDVSQIRYLHNFDRMEFTTNNSVAMQIDSGGNVTATSFTPSSRELKDEIIELDGTRAVEALNVMQPVEFVYKKNRDDRRVGFIAEDVPALVATPDRERISSMDIVAVVTKVVKDQQKTIEAQQQTISELNERLSKVELRQN